MGRGDAAQGARRVQTQEVDAVVVAVVAAVAAEKAVVELAETAIVVAAMETCH